MNPPLLSASLIVKDEEKDLPTCLRSLAGLVDEVVIYDTGSTDATAEVARHVTSELGVPLVFVEGYWDDDFARARNASLSHCSGEWVLWVDADDALVCADPGAVREQLRAILAGERAGDGGERAGDGGERAGDGSRENVRENVDACDIPVHSRGFLWHVNHFFRRERCAWYGRIHEVVRLLPDAAEPRHRSLAGIALAFSPRSGTATGGQRDADLVRRKNERNLRIAQVQEAHMDEVPALLRSYVLINVGRACMGANRMEEAMRLFRAGLAEPNVTWDEQRYAHKVIVRHVLASGTLDPERLDEADRSLAVLWRACESPALPIDLAAGLALRRGEADLDPGAREDFFLAAAAWANRLPRHTHEEIGDTYYDPGVVAAKRAEAVSRLGHYGEAGGVLLDALGTGYLGAELDTFLGILQRSGMSATDAAGTLAGAIPPWLLKPVLAQVAQVARLAPDSAGAVLDALRTKWPDEPLIPAMAAFLTNARAVPPAPPDRG